MTNDPKHETDTGRRPHPSPDPQPADDPHREPANSTVDDWFGQSVDRDAELADELLDEAGGDTDAAAEEFDELATGAERQAARHEGCGAGS